MYSFMLSTVATLALVAHTQAWGDLGHRTVGLLAQHYFTDAANNWVNSLINPTDSFDIGDAAVWADRIREKREYTAGWHFIDAKDSPPDSCSVSYSRDCVQDQGCIISAIVNSTALLTNSGTDANTQNEALKFLLHFIGDVHQPLHTESIDRGGNEIAVCFDNHCGHVSGDVKIMKSPQPNLHSVWDEYIIYKMRGLPHAPKHDELKAAAIQWSNELASSSAVQQAFAAEDECPDILQDPQSCALKFASEANALVCSYVLAPGLDFFASNDLAGGYYEGAVPIVKQQIVSAGVQLAKWVNAVAQPGALLVEQKEYL